MALTNRQVLLYQMTVTLWRQTETFAADGKPGALTWALRLAASAGTTVTTGAASATQTVGSTTGLAAGDTLYFATAAVSRVISSITSATVLVLTATVTTTTGEGVGQVVPCYADLGKSQMGPNGVLMVENDNLFTFDGFHFEQTIDVRMGDTLKMIAGPEVGKFWMVRGNDMTKNRRANKLSVLCSRTPTAPTGVS